ncbi:MAG: membrane or secreted protein, partial [Bacteroidota bacterium]|nr:membrane or secreted protein [Bacteroidota bacterium]
YYIPFSDTIPEFRNRAKMVYEFDAADVMQPIMYPAIARSFRTAGFQWATQFAYDPMYTAYANTEYQTHYLNLVYTPSKAISLMIASKAFHRLPRGKSYGAYPADTLFDVFRVSYKEQLSEMNSEEEFYYSNSTTTQPKNIAKLKHIAGVGSSPVVTYEGTGAYFLDKMDNGSWRLEVMPDAVSIKDPFEKTSPKKEVTLIHWQANKIEISLPDFSEKFFITGINPGNTSEVTSSKNSFFISPGVYVIGKANDRTIVASTVEFYAPKSSVANPLLVHHPIAEISSNQFFSITAKTIGVDSTDKVSIELRNSSNKWKTVTMQQVNDYSYKADIPVDIVTPGIINYRFMIKKANGETYTFPGGFKGDPFAWDEWRNETYQTFVAAPGSPLELFNPTTDRSKIMLYNTDWRNNTVEYITAGKPNQLVLKATMNKPTQGQFMGWQCFFGDKIAGRKGELSSFNKLVIRARSPQEGKAKLSLITTGAEAFATTISLTKDWNEIEIPLSSLQKGSLLLLPRPYPAFQPLRFTSSGNNSLNVSDIEKLEITFGEGASLSPVSIEVESISLKK